MQRVTIYLRTALFTFGGEAGHIPFGATVIVGTLDEQGGSGLTVTTAKILDERGRTVSEAVLKLLVPWSKVDHVRLD